MERVLVRRCESYDRDRIVAIVADALDRLGVAIRGRTFVKPNVVFAGAPEIFGRHAYTHPTFVGAALSALSRAPGVERLDLGENSAVGFPTRHCYRHAGYFDEIDRVQEGAGCPVGIFCIDEEPRDRVPVGGVVHEDLALARTVARAETKVYLPKLKCHCVSRMTGAVKLNIGLCGDDERAIRHDFMLNDKIVDLLAVGWPDLVLVDAIEVGVGNEAFPTPRQLGLVLIGTNPVAVDLVGARLLGLEPADVPYLARAIERGYRPAALEELVLEGDVTDPAELDRLARTLAPEDPAFGAWQDVERELARLGSPLRFFWGAHRRGQGERCETGCVMGVKMFLASYERYAGAEAFRRGKPAVFVVGRVDEPIDAAGAEVFLVGKCATAQLENARKVIRIDRCFTTARDLTFAIGRRLGIPAPISDPRMLGGLVRDTVGSSLAKLTSRRLFQDLWRK
jgi:uncharacterized protein (DUF362 family)